MHQKPDLGKQLKTARCKLGLSQSAAAKTWKINLRTLQAWEAGRNTPRGLALLALEQILSKIERS